MGLEPRLLAVAAAGVFDAISEAGGDSDRIFGAAKLNRADVENPFTQVDLRRFCDLLEQASRQTSLDSFGLRFGRAYKIEAMGSFATLALNSPTLGSALENLCRYHPIMQEHSMLTLQNDGGLLHLQYHIRDGRITRRRQDAELSIGVWSNFFRHCLGPGWSPEEIHFEHLRAADAREHEAIFNAPVYFGRNTNAIVFRRSDRNAAMPSPDLVAAMWAQSNLNRRLTQTRPDDFVGKVAQEIRLGFKTGDTSIESIANCLGMSRATLYRRLTQGGTEFSRLTQTLRLELALIYVSQPHIPFTEISELLGYSELSAFSRAFSRWTGASPANKRLSFEKKKQNTSGH